MNLNTIEGRKQMLIDWLESGNDENGKPIIKIGDKINAMKLLCQISGDFDKVRQKVDPITIVIDSRDSKL